MTLLSVAPCRKNKLSMKQLYKSIQNVVCFEQFSVVLMNFVNFLPLSLVDVTPK